MSAILDTGPLGFPWVTADPFLFCVHHDDAYPAGEENMGPKGELLGGRQLGSDFIVKDGFRMYHGEVVPGFPAHPHRGFETVTIVRKGFIDHSDSLGAAARFGAGDAQWITAGAGIQHAEMFPLLERETTNPLDLFQIWLNLPKAEKLADPTFVMLWDETIPRHTAVDAFGMRTEVMIVAGQLEGKRAPSPPPRSWAARADADVAIWSIAMEQGASFELPKTVKTTNRVIYFFRGPSLTVCGQPFSSHAAITLASDRDVRLEAGPGAVEMLMLQGRPIGEPVVQHGPFVMNTRREIQQAMDDYRRTHFGGWKWPSDAPVHARGEGRFAKYPDGRVDKR